MENFKLIKDELTKAISHLGVAKKLMNGNKKYELTKHELNAKISDLVEMESYL